MASAVLWASWRQRSNIQLFGLIPIVTRGGINVTTSGPLTIQEDVVTDGALVLATTESTAADTLTLLAAAKVINRTQNVTMTSADNLVVFGTIETGANAFLRAFNDVDLRASSIITAVNQILVTGDDGATNAMAAR